MLNSPSLHHFCDLTVELDTVREMGSGRAGQRRIIPIIGGTVEGPNVSGTILNLGADWQTVFHNGVAELDTRYAFETDSGALIEIQNYGFRHGPEDVIRKLADGEDCPPEHYYMRTSARLETGHPDYSWVNRMIFIGTGARKKSTVLMTLFTVT